MLIYQPITASILYLPALMPGSRIAPVIPRLYQIGEIVHESIVGRGAHALEQLHLLGFERAVGLEPLEVYDWHGLAYWLHHGTTLAKQAGSDNAGARYGF